MYWTKELTCFKKNSILVCTSHGGAIDEDALYEALKREQLSGAAKEYTEEGRIMRLGQEILQGAIDLHVHAAPDVIRRQNTDLELAHIYANAGMAGFVSKAHHGDMTARVAIIRKMDPTLKVFGGVTLNKYYGRN
jgi:hypothetical protein